MNRYLPTGYELRYCCNAGYYVITDIIGSGASTVAYAAEYHDVSGNITKHILKELNPSYIPFQRTEDGSIVLDEKQRKQFETAKERFVSGCNRQVEVRNQASMMNQTPVFEGQFSFNNTVYSDMVAYNGLTYDKAYKNLDMLDRIKVCLSAAKLVKCYHSAGYLCLDIKPENILVFPETKELLQFVDFDSICQKKDICFGGSISYTEAWAAPEQLNPYAHDKLSEGTDIYTLGELVFWSIFERHSYTEEHRGFSKYPFDNCPVDFNVMLGRNDVKKILTELFRNTIRSSVYNRYGSVDEIIGKLELLVVVLSEKEFVISSIPFFQKCIGRESELKQISACLKKESTVFITGMGGIGKSTVVRDYFTRILSAFDIALYLEYDGDVKTTFNSQVNINSVNQAYEESVEDYFVRKLSLLQAISHNKEVLLIIDNFSGKITKDLSRILGNSWKVIVVTRCIPPKCNYNVIQIDAITDKIRLYQIFEANLGHEIGAEEYAYVDDIINSVDSHTLVLELIAKQIASSHISISEAAMLSEKYGFSNIAAEKIEYIKDGVEYYDTISSIISALFDTSGLAAENKVLLKIVSLFGVTGIDMNMLVELLELKSKDGFNELEKDGWANIDNSQIKLHPVIAETVSSLEWTEDCYNAALLIMRKLFLFIKLEDRKEEVPKKVVQYCDFIKKYGHEKIIARMFDDDNYIMKTAYQRLLRDDAEEPADLNKLLDYVNISERFLNGISNVITLTSEKQYIALLYQTVMAMPLYREEYILRNAHYILEYYSSNKVDAIMKLYDRVVGIYLERKDFAAAYKEIGKAECFVKRHGSSNGKALYYDLLASYYDAKLNGSYDAKSEEDKHNLAMLLDSIDKSILFIKRSRNNVYKGMYLAKFLISKANVLMRSTQATQNDIDHIHHLAQKLIIKNTLRYSEVRFDYYMSNAWYFTLVVPSLSSLSKCIEKAYEIAIHIFRTELDVIDALIIPVANIFLEIKYHDRAAVWLNIGIRLCLEHSTIVPYIRKRVTLMKCLLDVQLDAGENEKCRELITQIEEENRLNSKLGIYIEIPKEVYEKVKPGK